MATEVGITITITMTLLILITTRTRTGAEDILITEDETVIGDVVVVIFVDCIIKLSEHGFPLTSFDLRIVINSYLEKIGRKVSSLKMAGMAFQIYEE